MSTITLVVPAGPMQALANRVWVGFDNPGNHPDTYVAFNSARCKDEEENLYFAYCMSDDADLFDSMPGWKDTPEDLYDIVANQYATNWPEETSPTLQEVTDFLAVVQVSNAYEILAGIADLGLIYYPVVVPL